MRITTLRALGVALALTSLSLGCRYEAIDLELLEGEADGTTNGNGNSNDNVSPNTNTNTNTNGNDNEPDENTPPVAVINDGRESLSAPANHNVTLSGERSFDDDFDPLSFTWTVSGDCALSGSADSERVAVEIENARCEVTLTVSDGLASASTSMTVTPSTVGTHVRETASCVNGPVDVASTAPVGVPGSPWCSLSDGLEAARLTGNLEVRLHQDPALSPPITIDSNIVVRGGWTGDELGWSWSPANVQSPVAIGAGNAITLNDGALESVAVTVNSPCTADCAAVRSTGGRARLANVTIQGRPSGSLVRYTAVRAVGSADFVAVELDRVTVQNPAGFGESIGVSVDGEANGATLEILNSQVTVGGANIATGVRTVNVVSAKLEDTEVAVSDTNIQTGYGFVDGSTTCSNGFPTCGGAESFAHVINSTIEVSANTAVGVLAQSTNVLRIEGTATGTGVFARGRDSAIGVRTLKTVGPRLLGDALIVSAETEVNGRAIGWSDGDPERAGLGSVDVEARAVVFRAIAEAGVAGGDGADELFAAQLTDTEGGADTALSECDFVAEQRGMVQAGRQVSLHTRDTANLTIEASRLTDVKTLSPFGLGGGFIDGELGSSGPVRGSVGLTLSGNTIDATLAARGSSSLAGECVFLAGTREARIEDNRIRCGGSVGDATEIQVRTLGTEKVVVRGNQIGAGGASRYFGLLDGPWPDEAGDTLPFNGTGGLGSTGLEIVANRVEALDAATSSATGIALGGDGRALVQNNGIALDAPGSYGLELAAASSAEMRHNTIQLLSTGSGPTGAALRVSFDAADDPRENVFTSNALVLGAETHAALRFESSSALSAAEAFGTVFAEAATNLLDRPTMTNPILEHESTQPVAAPVFDDESGVVSALVGQGFGEALLFGASRLCSDFVPASASDLLNVAATDDVPSRDLLSRERDDRPDIGAVERQPGDPDCSL